MQPELFIMVGISGSGKSTFANGLKTSKSATIVSTDDIREELFGDAGVQADGGRVFGIARKRVHDLLAQGKNAVIDATSLNAKDRRTWVEIGKANNAKITAYVVNPSIEKAKLQNQKRTRKVPDFVIDRQFAKFKMPSASEGIDVVVSV
jgi:predicted kinase